MNIDKYNIPEEYINEEYINKASMNAQLDKRGNIIGKKKYSGERAFSNINDIVIKFIDRHIGRSFNKSFHKFCELYPKHINGINTRTEFKKQFEGPDYGLYKPWYKIDGNGCIQLNREYRKKTKEPIDITITEPEYYYVFHTEYLERYPELESIFNMVIGKPNTQYLMFNRRISEKKYWEIFNSYDAKRLAEAFLRNYKFVSGALHDIMNDKSYKWFKEYHNRYEHSRRFTEYIYGDSDKNIAIDDTGTILKKVFFDYIKSSIYKTLYPKSKEYKQYNIELKKASKRNRKEQKRYDTYRNSTLLSEIENSRKSRKTEND